MRPRAQQPARSRTAAPPVRRMPAAGSTHEALVKPFRQIGGAGDRRRGCDRDALGRTAVAEAGRRAGRTGTVFVVYAYPDASGLPRIPLLRPAAECCSWNRRARSFSAAEWRRCSA